LPGTVSGQSYLSSADLEQKMDPLSPLPFLEVPSPYDFYSPPIDSSAPVSSAAATTLASLAANDFDAATPAHSTNKSAKTKLAFAPTKTKTTYIGVYPHCKKWRGVVKAMPGKKAWFDKGHQTPLEAAIARDIYIKSHPNAWAKMPMLDPKVQGDD